jgi:hypothetical protein
MKKFQLLKQTFPVSKFDRKCDAYNYIIETTSKEKREILGIDDTKLVSIIKASEKYMYRVGKENGKFKTMHISLTNFEIIRKHYFLFSDDM